MVACLGPSPNITIHASRFQSRLQGRAEQSVIAFFITIMVLELKLPSKSISKRPDRVGPGCLFAKIDGLCPQLLDDRDPPDQSSHDLARSFEPRRIRRRRSTGGMPISCSGCPS